MGMKKLITKILALCLLSGILLTVPEIAKAEENTAVESYEAATYGSSSYQWGYWRQTGGRWWFQFSDGSYAKNSLYEISGKVYAFDANGWMVTGWYYWNNQNTGESCWIYTDSNGVMVRGWRKIGGSWYYFNTQEKDSAGNFLVGFMYEGSMFDAGIAEINGTLYRFTSSGALYTGWLELDSDWYYFTTDGIVTGWQKIKNIWYYFAEDGYYMYSDEWYEIGGDVYWFTKSGAMHTGWLNVDGEWYYYLSSGKEARGWLKVGAAWYYFDPYNGAMHNSEWLEDDNGDWYYLEESGAMHTGWLDMDGSWLYYHANGKEARGWLQIGGTWYYFDLDSGWMYADNIYYIDGKWSKFAESGKWLGYTSERPPV